MLHVSATERFEKKNNPDILFALIPFTELESWNNKIHCSKGKVSDSSQRCIYDLDENGIITACRSLTHLQNCGKSLSDNNFSAGFLQYVSYLSKRLSIWTF